MNTKHASFLGLVLLGVVAVAASTPRTLSTFTRQRPTDIWLNQVGFYPRAPKVAVMPQTAATMFYVTSPDQRDTVLRGKLFAPPLPDYGNRRVQVADFSALKTVGRFVVMVPGAGASPVFAVQPEVHRALARAALKGFYYQRASTALLPKYAGEWSRESGHPDTVVLVHASAASAQQPAGTRISAPRGWYDAGDYNKYVVNSGITMGTLFALYEDFPEYSASLGTGIPESSNSLPDLLDELLWNLRWLLAMQDPVDGGVYHKLTNAEFDDLKTMPSAAANVRYVVQKSTPATLDFAAVTAQAARVLRGYGAVLPGLADSCLTAAQRAWQWAELHPAVRYDQNRLNAQYAPAIRTGEYGDRNFSDEWFWAAAELLVTTGDVRYFRAMELSDAPAPLPSWSQVRTLGYYTLLRRPDRLPPAARAVLPRVRALVVAAADSLLADANGQPHQAVFGRHVEDIVWGSTAVAANQGIALVQGYRLTGKTRYLQSALANLDYLLGRNATGYSFVTGFGTRTPLHPHHRLSVADGVLAPVPGLMVGGPNRSSPQQDHCTSYKSSVADETYTDDECSYASNEIAINWNAALVYLAAAIEALQYEAGFSPAARITLQRAAR